MRRYVSASVTSNLVAVGSSSAHWHEDVAAKDKIGIPSYSSRASCSLVHVNPQRFLIIL